MTGISAIAPSPRPDAAAPRAEPKAAREAPALVGPPLGRDEIAPMPAEITFGELLSALNPLHHIPVVGWIYRQITGETIQPAFRVLGGLLTGGPIGAIASAVGALAEELIGQVNLGGGTPAPTAIAAGPQPSADAGRFATLTTTAGQPLQPLPLATRLAARAYPAPSLPLRDAAPPPDPAAGVVPAAAALPGPDRAERPADDAAPAPAPQARIRRAPVIPVSAGGQDPAFVQRMMDGLAAYDRAMRSRATPATRPEAASAAP